MEHIMECLQETKNKTTIWSSSSPSEYIFEENENINSKEHMHLNVHESIMYSSQDMKAI